MMDCNCDAAADGDDGGDEEDEDDCYRVSFCTNIANIFERWASRAGDGLIGEIGPLRVLTTATFSSPHFPSAFFGCFPLSVSLVELQTSFFPRFLVIVAA